MSPFESFDALLRAHFALRRSVSKRDATNIKEQIQDFIRQAPEVGAILGRSDQRKVAQSILDYWVAQLIVLAPEQVDYSDSAVLVECRSPQPGDGSDKSEAIESKTIDRVVRLEEDKIDKIRFVAAARLWESKGRDEGYLLFGKAIEDASKFRADPDIDNLVAASEAYESNRRKVSIAVAATSLALLLVFIGFQFFWLPPLRDFIINGIIRGKEQDSKILRDVLGVDPTELKSVGLRSLGWFQYWLPPYDLSGEEVKLSGNKLTGLKLYAPNFSSAELGDVNFAGATLESASFSGGTIKNSHFDNANLNTSQFKRANITDSSFENAKLYRAIFDKSCLTGVDFKGAFLRSASFSGAHWNENFAENFRDTGWWFAYGWNSKEIEALSSVDQTGVAQSEAFKYQLGSDIDKLRNSRPGTGEQANALNRVAWTMATWGVGDLGEAPGELKAACGPANKRLTSALDFADEGICIARRLKAGRPGGDLANFRDTRAYLLIQQGNLTEAYQEYQGLIGNDGPGDRLFRAAIVAAALSRTDQARSSVLKMEADAKLQKSLALGYFPSHELQTLKNDIPEDFLKRIYDNNDKLWPQVQDCERPNSDAVN